MKLTFIKNIKETTNEVFGNTDWYECRMCKTQTSKANTMNRYLLSLMIPLTLYSLIATFAFFLLYPFIKETFLIYCAYLIGFGFLLVYFYNIQKKANQLEKEDENNHISCPNCGSDYLRPITRNNLQPII